MMKIKKYISSPSFITGLICIALYFLVEELFSVFVSRTLTSAMSSEAIKNNAPLLNGILNLIVLTILFIPLTFGLLKNDIQTDFFEARKNTSKFAKQILFGILLVYVFSIVANIIKVSIFKQTTDAENQKAIDEILSSSVLSYIIMGIGTMFLAPIVEELVFRKSFFKIIKNDIIALLVSSFTFGILHALSTPGNFGYKLIYAIPYFASGLAFGIAYIKSDKNVTVSIAIHMINNIFATLMTSSLLTIIL